MAEAPAARPPQDIPWLAIALISLNLCLYLAPAAVGLLPWPSLVAWSVDPRETEWLFRRLGALDHGLWRDQPWRLLSASTLHGGVLHLAMNSCALFAVGSRLERLVGPYLCAWVYFAAVLVGSLGSLLWRGPGSGLGIGASGGICGVAAAIIVVWLLLRHRFSHGAAVAAARRLGALLLLAIGLPIVIDAFVPTGLDHAAHIGGAIGGATAAALLVAQLPVLTKVVVQRFVLLPVTLGLLVVAYAAPVQGIFGGEVTVADLVGGLEPTEVPELGIVLPLPDWEPDPSSALPSWRGHQVLLETTRYETPIRASTPSLLARQQLVEQRLDRWLRQNEITAFRKVDHVDLVGDRPGGVMLTYLLETPGENEFLYVVRLFDLPQAAVDMTLQIPDGEAARKLGALTLAKIEAL